MTTKPTSVAAGGIEWPHGDFATFDPAIDGLKAPIDTLWVADDCPVVKRKIGVADTAWIFSGQGQTPPLAACTTLAQVNALCQGIARRPDLDFTPFDLGTPDIANNRISFLSGNHWTLQGAGAGASIVQGPYFDAQSPHGAQVFQTAHQQSYYRSANAVPFDVAGESFVWGLDIACPVNGNGGFSISKIHQPGDPFTGRGYGMTINGDGGFGFNMNGASGILNTDTAVGTVNVADGIPRMYFFGRNVQGGGLGFAYNGNTGIGQAGHAGSLTNADGVAGLSSDTFSTPVEASPSQAGSKYVFWKGVNAENLITFVPKLAQVLQGTLGESYAPAQLYTQKTPGLVGTMTVTTPARTLDNVFQPSLTRPVRCVYSVEVGSGGAGTGYVELRCDENNPPVKAWGRSGSGVNVGIVVLSDGVLTCDARPGDFVELVSVTIAGAPGFAIKLQTEVIY